MVKKIYIIGPVGSGKTTFAKKLSEKYDIDYYELDKVSWDDENGNVKRTLEDTMRIFNDIISKDSWIIEDVGRNKFVQGRIDADVIYYINISLLRSFLRVTKRWIKQRIGKEKYDYPPTLKNLIYIWSVVNIYKKREKEKIASLEEYNKKLVYVNTKDIKRME